MSVLGEVRPKLGAIFENDRLVADADQIASERADRNEAWPGIPSQGDHPKHPDRRDEGTWQVSRGTKERSVNQNGGLHPCRRTTPDR